MQNGHYRLLDHDVISTATFYGVAV
jgi:hypothetical protein